jgi:hypothetical protein
LVLKNANRRTRAFLALKNFLESRSTLFLTMQSFVELILSPSRGCNVIPSHHSNARHSLTYPLRFEGSDFNMNDTEQGIEGSTLMLSTIVEEEEEQTPTQPCSAATQNDTGTSHWHYGVHGPCTDCELGLSFWNEQEQKDEKEEEEQTPTQPCSACLDTGISDWSDGEEGPCLPCIDIALGRFD